MRHPLHMLVDQCVVWFWVGRRHLPILPGPSAVGRLSRSGPATPTRRTTSCPDRGVYLFAARKGGVESEEREQRDRGAGLRRGLDLVMSIEEEVGETPVLVHVVSNVRGRLADIQRRHRDAENDAPGGFDVEVSGRAGAQPYGTGLDSPTCARSWASQCKLVP